ncbi:MAG: cytochrome P450 [Myxococcota bacterium]
MPAMIDFNPQDPSFIVNPYPVFRQLRTEAPLYYWEQGRAWLLSRYEDVRGLLKDPRCSPDVRHWKYYRPEDMHQGPEMKVVSDNGLFGANPEDHRRIRQTVRSAFTPSAATRQAEIIGQVVEELIAEAEIDARDSFDLVKALAEPMPIRVIGRMLGVPRSQERDFRQWANVVVTLAFPNLPPEVMADAAARFPAGYRLMERLIEERRQDLGDDLLSALISAQDGDRGLSDGELLSMVAGLIAAGSETTVHLMAFAVHCLLRFPEVEQRVRADRSLVPGLVEEVLRFDNFGSMGVPRYLLEDMELHGERLGKGEMLMCLLGAAMHDDGVWPDAERFDIDRSPIPNISFGVGPHFCLGAHLARKEVSVALNVLFDRYPVLERAGEPRFDPHPLMRHLASLPVRVRPNAQPSGN